MTPLALSDAELAVVMQAAQPLAPDQRDGFLQAVAAELAQIPAVGPGAVHRVCRQLAAAILRPASARPRRLGEIPVSPPLKIASYRTASPIGI
jgi:hypothetical protein